MDLLERGRSLSELGRTLRWTDIHALLLHLPPDSYMRKAVARLGPESGEIQAPSQVSSRASRDSKARSVAERIRAEMKML